MIGWHLPAAAAVVGLCLWLGLRTTMRGLTRGPTALIVVGQIGIPAVMAIACTAIAVDADRHGVGPTSLIQARLDKVAAERRADAVRR